MKRSQRFSRSFSFGEDHQLQPTNENREEEEDGADAGPVPGPERESAAGCTRSGKRETFMDTGEPQRTGLFRPQTLWLAMARCLSLHWPPCLPVSRQSNRKLAYPVGLDQSEDTASALSSDWPGRSSASSDDAGATLVRHQEREWRDVQEVASTAVKSVPLPGRGVSRSSPRLPRARQAADAALVSVILEKEMFLRVELVEEREEREELRYRAEWRLSERTQKLAEGVWLPPNQKN